MNEFQVTSVKMYNNVMEQKSSTLLLVMSQRKWILCESSPYEHILQRDESIGTALTSTRCLKPLMFLTGPQYEASVQHNVTQGLTINKFYIQILYQYRQKCVISDWLVSCSCIRHMIGIYNHSKFSNCTSGTF